MPRGPSKRARELAAQRRAEIDASFAEMASDAEYQKEALRITEEFAVADWEALQLGDREYPDAS